MKISEIEKRRLINYCCERIGAIGNIQTYPGNQAHDEIKQLAYRIIELIDGVDLDQYRKHDSRQRSDEG